MHHNHPFFPTLARRVSHRLGHPLMPEPQGHHVAGLVIDAPLETRKVGKNKGDDFRVSDFPQGNQSACTTPATPTTIVLRSKIRKAADETNRPPPCLPPFSADG